ncbi:MAG: killer suppression protein HigA [Verrucomicrobia bacterium]|nr:killer suppression protein HigA [Verrucomicrobiota bacterium]
MEIFFSDDKLQELCENDKQMTKKLGKIRAQKLKRRIADLRAASSVSDLVAGRPHPLKYKLKDAYAIDLTDMIRLIFESANIPIPRNNDETVDWKNVTMVRIVSIEDYHE